MSDLITWHAPYAGWVVLTAVGLLGVLVMRIGLRRRDAKIDSNRCPCCRYDMRFSPGPICSECGSDRSLTTPFHFRRWWLAAVGLLIAAALPVYVVQMRVRQYGWIYYECVGPLYYVLPPVTLQHFQFRGIDFRRVMDRRQYLDDPPFRTIDLVCNERTIDTIEGANAEVGWAAGNADALGLQPIDDLDGDGVPELIVHSCSDGNSGEQWLTAYTLGPQVRPWRSVAPSHFDGDPGNSQPADSFSRNADGSVEISALDHTFVFWRVCHAESPYPQAKLRCRHGRFEVDPEAMRRPPPSADDLQHSIASCLAAQWDASQGVEQDQPAYPELLRTMLDLIYSGHADEAYAFLDRAWPGPVKLKELFRRDFVANLSQSPYADALVALGHPPFTELDRDRAAAKN